MKKRVLFLITLILLTVTNSLLAQGTAFTYQGQLTVTGSPANGNYDFQFSLFNAASGGTQVGSTITETALGVTNGLFTTALDFGAVFTGNATWLSIGVRSNGMGSYTAMSPLQELTPAPYAIYAPNAGAAATANSVAGSNIVGTVPAGQLPSSVITNGEDGLSLSGNFSGNGAGLTNLSAAGLPSNVALLNGNQTFAGTNTFSQQVVISSPNPWLQLLGSASGTATIDLTTYNPGTNAPPARLQISDDDWSGDWDFYSKQQGADTNSLISLLHLSADGISDAFQSSSPIGTWLSLVNTSSGGDTWNFISSGSDNGEGAGKLLLHEGYDGNTIMTVQSNGNVGINTSTPTNTLDVNGNIHASGTFIGNGGGLTNLSTAQLTGFTPTTPPANGYPILNMVWIMPGTFVMGAPTSDPDYQSDETQHVVTLTNGFWMGQHPVTQGEYLAVIGSNPSSFTGDLTRPVDSVTWFNASNFCYVLTQNEQSAGRLPAGWVYRLPTESEWEYCCRAQTTSRYYFGNDPGDGTSLTNYAWYGVNSGSTTQPVGQLLPNAWGLVDMAGNVFEWCQDWYGTYPTANVSYNPQGPASGSYRVLRGGDWDGGASFCRSAYRSDGLMVVLNGVGFRVVLAPGQ